MKIKIDPADRVFSQYIRKRDKKCIRCRSPVEFNEKGLPVSHQASHYFSRGKESTRFSQINVDTLCFPCHNYWGGEGREEYKSFKIKQLGQEGFERLRALSEMFVKKDRKLAYIISKKLLENL